jgi:hypothetical protein
LDKEVVDSEPPLSADDLIFEYKGVRISHRRPLTEIAGELGFVLDGREQPNRRYRVNQSTTGEGIYTWYLVHSPNIYRKELTLEYLFNATTGEGWLLAVRMFTEDSLQPITRQGGADLFN